MQEESRFAIHLEHLQDYEFKVKFDWPEAPDMVMDEPPPLGHQHGPNASRLLAAAVANCLTASLLFCLKKNSPPVHSVKTEASCILGRNDNKRLRISHLEVVIAVDNEPLDGKRLKRCLDMFEEFCVVTASIRSGIPVKVLVTDSKGQVLHEGQ